MEVKEASVGKQKVLEAYRERIAAQEAARRKATEATEAGGVGTPAPAGPPPATDEAFIAETASRAGVAEAEVRALFRQYAREGVPALSNQELDSAYRAALAYQQAVPPTQPAAPMPAPATAKPAETFSWWNAAKNFGSGMWKQAKEMVGSVVEHPVMTAAVLGGTVALLGGAAVVTGLSMAAVGTVVGVGFGAAAAWGLVKSTRQAYQHYQKGEFKQAEQDFEGIGRNAFDLGTMVVPAAGGKLLGIAAETGAGKAALLAAKESGLGAKVAGAVEAAGKIPGKIATFTRESAVGKLVVSAAEKPIVRKIAERARDTRQALGLDRSYEYAAAKLKSAVKWAAETHEANAQRGWVQKVEGVLGDGLEQRVRQLEHAVVERLNASDKVQALERKVLAHLSEKHPHLKPRIGHPDVTIEKAREYVGFKLKGGAQDTIYITDVHGSPENFRAQIKDRPFGERSVFGGDLLNKGPDSREVVKILRENPEMKAIMGNHDFHPIAALERVPDAKSLEALGEAALRERAENLQIGKWLEAKKLKADGLNEKQIAEIFAKASDEQMQVVRDTVGEMTPKQLAEAIATRLQEVHVDQVKMAATKTRAAESTFMRYGLGDNPDVGRRAASQAYPKAYEKAYGAALKEGKPMAEARQLAENAGRKAAAAAEKRALELESQRAFAALADSGGNPAFVQRDADRALQRLVASGADVKQLGAKKPLSPEFVEAIKKAEGFPKSERDALLKALKEADGDPSKLLGTTSLERAVASLAEAGGDLGRVKRFTAEQLEGMRAFADDMTYLKDRLGTYVHQDGTLFAHAGLPYKMENGKAVIDMKMLDKVEQLRKSEGRFLEIGGMSKDDVAYFAGSETEGFLARGPIKRGYTGKEMSDFSFDAPGMDEKAFDAAFEAFNKDKGLTGDAAVKRVVFGHESRGDSSGATRILRGDIRKNQLLADEMAELARSGAPDAERALQAFKLAIDDLNDSRRLRLTPKQVEGLAAGLRDGKSVDVLLADMKLDGLKPKLQRPLGEMAVTKGDPTALGGWYQKRLETLRTEFLEHRKRYANSDANIVNMHEGKVILADTNMEDYMPSLGERAQQTEGSRVRLGADGSARTENVVRADALGTKLRQGAGTDFHLTQAEMQREIARFAAEGLDAKAAEEAAKRYLALGRAEGATANAAERALEGLFPGYRAETRRVVGEGGKKLAISLVVPAGAQRTPGLGPAIAAELRKNRVLVEGSEVGQLFVTVKGQQIPIVVVPEAARLQSPTALTLAALRASREVRREEPAAR